MDNFKVMLAQPLQEHKISFPCYVSPKLDGIRALYYNGEFYTRNKKKIYGMDHIKSVLATYDISLDGELLIPGQTFQYSSGKIRSYNDTPDAVYHVFDAPHILAPQNRRLEVLQEMFTISRLHTCDCVTLVEHTIIKELEDVFGMYSLYRQRGFEGAMVKSLTAPYVNRRAVHWMKMKEIETYDVVCVGFFEGQGRLTGTLGGIVVELDGTRIRVGGGFSDSDRDHVWRCRDQYRGRVCEVAAQELTPDGSLRHPRLVGWRFDLDKE